MITANEAYALTKMNIAKKAREAYTDALNVAKHTDDRTSVAICEKVYVDVIDIVNAAVELLVTLAESAGDKKAKKHAYSVLEKMEKTFIDYKTADRVKKLFDAGNKEFTDFATTDVNENTPIAGYTVDDFIEIINRNHLCKTKPYIFRRVSDKNRVLKINEIISLSNVIRFYFDGKINVNNLNVTLAKYGMVLADNPDVRNCNIAIYGISEKTQKLLTKFMCENNLKFSIIEETTNNAPCKMVVKDKHREAIVPVEKPIEECEALFTENRGAE